MGQRKKIMIGVVAGMIVAALSVLVVAQIIKVTEAHRTLENYSAFRGCVEQLQKADDWATCRLATGAIIKMVMVNGKWYLDGDLPVCYFKFCW